MPALPAVEVFSSDTRRPIQQGDIFLTTAIVRVTPSGATFAPAAWAVYETARMELVPAGLPGAVPSGQDVADGAALVMVVSHDCHLDKELHLAARALRKADPGLDADAAYEQAEADPTLDRHLLVSPLVGPDDLPAAADSNTARMLRAGRVVGYFPIPASATLALGECVADLGRRTTVDRLALGLRLSSLTDPARLRLRYALARMDSIRTPDVGAELEAAIGRRIAGVERPTGKRTTVLLELDDGSVLELLPRPADTPADRLRREQVPTGGKLAPKQ